MGNVYLGDKKVTSEGWYLGDTPLFEPPLFIDENGKKYYEEDCHIFVANGEEVKLPVPTDDPDNCSVVFVTVDGVEVTPIFFEEEKYPGEEWAYWVRHWTIPANENQTIHAIFDWDNADKTTQNWWSELLQIGLNSETGKRNQLKSGRAAFRSMKINPDLIANLDISNLTDMGWMFYGTTSFNLDISGWDVSNVEDMDYMFGSATAFNQDISGWNISNVKNMGGMFSSSSFNPDISGWDTSNVEKMYEMFSYNAAFNQDISGWDTSNVESMNGMFWGASSFNSDLSKWNTSKVTDMGYMFYSASNFNSDLSKWNTSKVTDMKCMFWATVIFDQDLSGWNVSNVEDMDYMFSGAAKFNADLSKWDVSKVKKMGGMFRTTSFNHDISGWNTSSCTDMRAMFSSTPFNYDISKWDTSQVTSMNSMFAYSPFNHDISGWDTSKVVAMNSMFQGNKAFNKDISKWDTSSVKYMQQMFNAATAFNQDLSQWCVINVTDNSYFSHGASAYTKPKPVWGTCPRGEGDEGGPDDGENKELFPIEIDGVTYEEADAHIFIANGNEVQLPIASGTLPTFVSVNGVDVTPTSFVTRTVERKEIGEDGVRTTSTEEVQTTAIAANDGDFIHAIFDWDNTEEIVQDWFSDILQFGLNSVTGKRNQLKIAESAFTDMTANPVAIANLDVSNLTEMTWMFVGASNFNQDISHWDTSNVTNMKFMFYYAEKFNSDISGWDVSNVDNMSHMFMGAKVFNIDISGWDTSKVTDMQQMFANAGVFNQDLSQWCVIRIDEMPSNFDRNSGFLGQTEKQPQWGTCPREEFRVQWPITIDGVTYEEADAHIFVANGTTTVNFPVPADDQWNCPVVFAAVNGVRVPVGHIEHVSHPEMEFDYRWATYARDGDIVHAIFDWDQPQDQPISQEWISDILQFGLNSETGKRNQLKSGVSAFYEMTANPAYIANLDTSNLTDMDYMFGYAQSFNQDLSKWCVSNIASKPVRFDEGAYAWEGGEATRPQWGTCPRGENLVQWPITIDGVTYYKEDAHVFVANGIPPGSPITLPCDGPPIFVARNGVEYEDYSVLPTNDGDIIEAIFDWDNMDHNDLNWFHDILQFGSRSVWDESQSEWFKEPEGYVNPPALPSGRIPNQLKGGTRAFCFMTEEGQNPALISSLDVSNLTTMRGMFELSPRFNQDISGWDTSNMDDMSHAFAAAASFNADISGWDTSNVKYMDFMFTAALSFNQDISGWDTSKVETRNHDQMPFMEGMFKNAASFNQDLSEWCVGQFDKKPVEFDLDANAWEGGDATRPQWGTCPRFEDIQLPDGYELKDCHIFVANGNKVRLPVPSDEPDNCPVFFAAVDGVEVTPTIANDSDSLNHDYWTIPANENQIIHAIFDWNSPKYYANQDWFSNILQFGLNSETGKRNQLKSGEYAFTEMEANPAIISTLDVSNLTSMLCMFDGARSFNQPLSNWDTCNVTNMGGVFAHAPSFNEDISGWDTSNVENMSGMFNGSHEFNQDISGWDTSNVTNMALMFIFAKAFNSDISEWDVSKVEHMNSMFQQAMKFNQNLSQWCVSQFDEKPDEFDTGTGLTWREPRPVWGTCPGPDDVENIKIPNIDNILPDPYETPDCHVFIANGATVQFPIPKDNSDNPPTFVAVDGVEVAPIYAEEILYPGEAWEKAIYYWTVPAARDQIIHAIFDWDNQNRTEQKWFSNILQFGLNSETNKRNQLKSAEYAFYGMVANPAAISNLDISNLTSMKWMFNNAVFFNLDISGWDVSNVTDMYSMFDGTLSFNQDIGGWDMSNVTDMSYMLSWTKSFDQDISGWDTSNVTSMKGMFDRTGFNRDISQWNTKSVTDMDLMFNEAYEFDQDLSQWCVSKIAYKPGVFDTDSGFAGQPDKQPKWGTCPRGEDIPPGGYSIEDCHIFVANGNAVDFAIVNGTSPVFVAVDGVEKDYDTEVKGKVFDGSTIHAIFNWDNQDWHRQDWFSDILQFGLNSVTGKRNQLMSTESAFLVMEANPAAIVDLDISNGNKMNFMFERAPNFNQDIGGWDVSKVTHMNSMFRDARAFNQDLSGWCVSKIDTRPTYFEQNATLAGYPSKQPQWGTCPRGEDKP